MIINGFEGEAVDGSESRDPEQGWHCGWGIFWSGYGVFAVATGCDPTLVVRPYIGSVIGDGTWIGDLMGGFNVGGVLLQSADLSDETLPAKRIAPVLFSAIRNMKGRLHFIWGHTPNEIAPPVAATASTPSSFTSI